jgi:hypothetical protein
MTTIGKGESQSFNFEKGKPGIINVNSPCRFVVETSTGSDIEGLITPNNPLTITPHGDIANVNVYIEEGSIQKPSSVESESLHNSDKHK